MGGGTDGGRGQAAEENRYMQLPTQHRPGVVVCEGDRVHGYNFLYSCSAGLRERSYGGSSCMHALREIAVSPRLALDYERHAPPPLGARRTHCMPTSETRKTQAMSRPLTGPSTFSPILKGRPHLALGSQPRLDQQMPLLIVGSCEIS